jgi:hypothetical protein
LGSESSFPPPWLNAIKLAGSKVRLRKDIFSSPFSNI